MMGDAFIPGKCCVRSIEFKYGRAWTNGAMGALLPQRTGTEGSLPEVLFG